MQFIFEYNSSNLLYLISFGFPVFKALQINNFFDSLPVIDVVITFHSYRKPKIIQEFGEILKSDIFISQSTKNFI